LAFAANHDLAIHIPSFPTFKTNLPQVWLGVSNSFTLSHGAKRRTLLIQVIFIASNTDDASDNYIICPIFLSEISQLAFAKKKNSVSAPEEFFV